MSPILQTFGNASASGYGFSLGAAVAAGSFESIATVTVGSGGSSSVTFSSIPGTYTHLQIRALVQTNRSTASTDYIPTRFNSDSGNNYAYHTLTGNGSSASAGRDFSVSYAYLDGAGTTSGGSFGAWIFDVLDYANTNKYKTIRVLGGADANGSGGITLSSGLWQNTSAVTSITMVPFVGTSFSQYSSFALYGIKGS